MHRTNKTHTHILSSQSVSYSKGVTKWSFMNRREVQKDLKVRRRRKENTGKLKRKIIKAFPVRFSGSFVPSSLPVWKEEGKRAVFSRRESPAHWSNAPEWLSNLEIHAKNWIFLGFNEDISQAGQHFSCTAGILCLWGVVWWR